MFKRKNRGVKLTKEQQEIKDLIIANLNSGIYKEEPLPCLCGSDNDEIIAVEDRYGIPFKTVICKHCGLIRSNPYYDNSTLTNFYGNYYRILYQTKEYSDEQFEIRKEKGEGYVNTIESKLNIKVNNQTIFEIGCAGGAILQAFKDNGCNVYGCDYGKSYLEFGRKKGLILEEGSYEQLKKYGQADIIVLSHVLEHIINPIAFLNNIKALLKNDGFLYIVLPTIETIGTTYSKDIFRYLQNAHVYNFSINSMQYIAECSGYSCELVEGTIDTFICKKSESVRNLNNILKDEYKLSIKKLSLFERQYLFKNFLDNIFSVHNEVIDERKFKRISILGLQFYFEAKNCS